MTTTTFRREVYGQKWSLWYGGYITLYIDRQYWLVHCWVLVFAWNLLTVRRKSEILPALSFCNVFGMKIVKFKDT